MNSKQILLVRHGETFSNSISHRHGKVTSHNLLMAVDPCLSKVGHRQSKAVAELLSSLSKDVKILVSPMYRTRQTSQYLIGKGFYNWETIPHLQELMPENVQGLKYKQDKTWKNFVDRVQSIISHIESLQSNTVIVFGHSQFFTMFLGLIDGHRMDDPSILCSVNIPNCSIIKLYYDKAWTIAADCSIPSFKE